MFDRALVMFLLLSFSHCIKIIQVYLYSLNSLWDKIKIWNYLILEIAVVFVFIKPLYKMQEEQ